MKFATVSGAFSAFSCKTMSPWLVVNFTLDMDKSLFLNAWMGAI
jgi:hypothetical protein